MYLTRLLRFNFILYFYVYYFSVTIMPASICASDGSIAEYLHTDLDTNVTLTEARWPITCTATIHSRRSIDWKTFSELSMCSDSKSRLVECDSSRSFLCFQ